jgi:hypothetical protein
MTKLQNTFFFILSRFLRKWLFFVISKDPYFYADFKKGNLTLVTKCAQKSYYRKTDFLPEKMAKSLKISFSLITFLGACN